MINLLNRKFYRLKYRIIYFYQYRIKKSSLETHLIKNNELEWLDIGSSANKSNLNFKFCDIYPVDECIPEFRDKYFQIDITKELSVSQIKSLGKYNFIRMQHVFEHFSYEDANIVLQNCSKLLKTKGLLLITVPDLDIFINSYKKNTLKVNNKFFNWAIKRVNKNSPPSDFFSVFTHSLPHQSHKWCYNKEGLIYKIKSTGLFSEIKKVGLFHGFSNIPFTHNRPEEDLCIIAKKIN